MKALVGAICLSFLVACSRIGATQAPNVPENFPPMFSGERDQQSASFTLTGGDYVVDWSATDVGQYAGSGCYHSARLSEDDGDGSEHFLSTNPDGGQTTRGTANLHDVPAGRWYFETISGCAWTLAIRR